MKANKNIVVLTNSLRGGGAERVASLVADHLAESSACEVDILIFENIKKYKPVKSNIIDLSILPAKLISSSFILRLINYFGAVIRFLFYISNEKPSAMISFLPRANIVSGLIGKLFCDVCISCEHSSIAKLYKKKLSRVIIRNAYNRCDAIIAVSRGVKLELEQLGIDPKKIKVISNPINVEAIKAKSALQPAEFEFESNWHYVVNVGTISKEKGQAGIIKAAALIPPSERVKFLFIGDGPDKKRLQDEVEKHKLSGKINFLGWQDNPFAFLKRSHLLVHTSNRETWGLSIIEAAICGLPILAYEVDYLQDWATRDQWVKLIPYGDINSMAKYVIRMIRLKESENIPGGIERASMLGLYDEKDILRQYSKTVKDMMENK